MSGDQRMERRRRSRWPQTPKEIKLVGEYFRAMLRTMYAEEDAEDERALAELTELRLAAAERWLAAAERSLQHSQHMLAEWQSLLDEVVLMRRTMVLSEKDGFC